MDGLTHRIDRGVPAEQSARVTATREPLAMQGAEGGAVAGPREDQLVAAAESRLEMRQDRADQDPQVGLGDRPEDPHGDPPGRGSQVDVGRQVVDRGAEASIPVRDLLADASSHRRRVDSVMPPDTGGDGHILDSYARRVQTAEDDREGVPDGRPARRVVDDDGHGRAGPDELLQRCRSFRIFQGHRQGPGVVMVRAIEVGPGDVGLVPCEC